MNDSAEKYEFEKLSANKIKFLMSKGAKYLISYLNIPKYKIPFLMQEIKDKLAVKIPLLHPIKGIPDLINNLYKKQVNIGILTSNSKENVELFLFNNKLNKFSFIYHGSSLFGKDKLLKKMFKEQPINKSETVYVGDEDRDVIASKAIGIKSIAVTWGFNSKKLLLSCKPDFIADYPSDILKILN